jgi:hypothetical protein
MSVAPVHLRTRTHTLTHTHMTIHTLNTSTHTHTYTGAPTGVSGVIPATPGLDDASLQGPRPQLWWTGPTPENVPRPNGEYNKKHINILKYIYT